MGVIRAGQFELGSPLPAREPYQISLGQARSSSPISAMARATSAFAGSANATIGSRVLGRIKPSMDNAYFRAAGLSLESAVLSGASRFCRDRADCNRPWRQFEKMV